MLLSNAQAAVIYLSFTVPLIGTRSYHVVWNQTPFMNGSEHDCTIEKIALIPTTVLGKQNTRTIVLNEFLPWHY